MPITQKIDARDDLKILLVEDSRGDAAAFKRAMTRVNPAVHICVVMSAEEAVTMFELGCDFGLCIFDINLPRLSGLDLLATVKPWRQFLPMMILSSSESTADIAGAFSHGADGYVVKPFDVAGFDNIARYICGLWFDGVATADSCLRVILPNGALTAARTDQSDVAGALRTQPMREAARLGRPPDFIGKVMS